ncbi:MAG: sugar ABC transporter substrate-binding protein [Eubacteriales bacterium]|nr:sugar ABC transporter substrate-binding protein [Eubacteriales bacterium]
MKAKKRMGAMLLAGAMIVGMLAGCGSSPDKSTAEGSGTSGSDSYNVGFIVKLTDGHFSKVIAGAEAYAEEHPNVNVDILSPTSATAYDEQVNMIETCLSDDSKSAIVISPLQSDSAATLVANTDKTIVACDTDFTSEKKSTFVGTGNKDAAKEGGKAAVEEAIARGAKKGEVTAVILTGVQGDETHDARMEGYTEGIEEAGGKVLEVQYCDAVADKAANAMEAIVLKYADGVDVVCCTNDDMVMAASKAMKDAGNAAYDDTVLCGFDGNQAALQAVKDGEIAMDVAQEGYQMGYKAVEAAINIIEGNSVESFIDSGSTIVSADNVDDYIQSMKDIGVWEG